MGGGPFRPVNIDRLAVESTRHIEDTSQLETSVQGHCSCTNPMEPVAPSRRESSCSYCDGALALMQYGGSGRICSFFCPHPTYLELSTKLFFISGQNISLHQELNSKHSLPVIKFNCRGQVQSHIQGVIRNGIMLGT